MMHCLVKLVADLQQIVLHNGNSIEVSQYTVCKFAGCELHEHRKSYHAAATLVITYCYC